MARRFYWRDSRAPMRGTTRRWLRRGDGGAWCRARFRYADSRSRAISDEERIARIEALAIPPAWRDVCISPRPRAKVQATGLDAAGRKQYIYNAEYRAAQEQAKFDKLSLLPSGFCFCAPRWPSTWNLEIWVHTALAERRPAQSEAEAERTIAAVMKTVGERLGNTPEVAHASYVSPAVVAQYLDGRTIEDFRPRHLRVVGARDIDLDPEEQAVLSLLRSWRIRRARDAA